MNNIFFASDHHLNHYNIIRYDNRPFSSIAEMNETLIDNHNKLVKKNDIVWFLGDLYLGNPKFFFEIMSRFNGRKNVILGNHDKWYKKISANELRLLFDHVSNYTEYAINGHKYVLCHYPILSWRGKNRGSIHIHGHNHKQWTEQIIQKIMKNSFNVCVNLNDHKPVSIEELK
jgi:calcineurin-like phosphoesterase family protein